jgi:acyl carrier protein
LRDSQSDKKTEYKDDVHEQLSNIWKEIIDLPEDYNVSFDDSFFELGGHSISIIQLITSINEKYSIELPISILNDNITLRSIYDIVKGNEGI